MKIKTERLAIRRTTHEETKQISTANNTGSVDEFLGSLSNEEIAIIFQNKDAVSDLLTRFSNSIGNGDTETYGAWKDEKLIGFSSLINAESGTPELQIEIDPQFQGKGYGFEFLRALLGHLFETRNFQYIRYTVLPNNQASISLVEKIGASLQEPKSDAERLLIRTYHITKT